MPEFVSVRNGYDVLKFDKQPESIEEALDLSGLNWMVLSKPAYFLDNADEMEAAEDPDWDGDEYPQMLVQPVDGWFVNVRSDTNVPLGIVSTRYSNFHNIQAFGFLSHIFKSEMDFVSAGDFRGGKRVWVVMQLPSFIEVGGDQISQYAFVHTSHDGKHSVTATMTPYRWLSATIVPSEVRRAKDKELNARRVLGLRHSGDMESKMARLEAERVLDFTVNYYKQFKLLGDLLAEKKPSKRDQQTYVEALIEIPENQGDRAQANAQQARDMILKIFWGKGPEGDTQGNSPGTWWALYNAAVEYSQWVRPERKQGGRFMRTIDDPDSFATKAFDLALGGARL
jgi:phage/plasmid-like protein (TIGR03299 family)